MGALATLLGASRAEAVPLLVATETSTTGRTLSVDLGAEVHVLARGTRDAKAEWDTRYRLSRARLDLAIRWGEWLRVVLEPDFASQMSSSSGELQSADVDLSDAFFDVRPIEGVEFRVGQMNVPFGLFETIGRWRLPAQRRGLVSELVFDRDQLGYGRRKRGAMTELELGSWLGVRKLRPKIRLGTFFDGPTMDDRDHALRLSVRPWLPGSELALGGYIGAKSATGGGDGHAASLSFDIDRRGLFLAAELLVGRAARLTREGSDVGADATFLAPRILVAWAIHLDDSFAVEPFLGLEGFDAGLHTRDDLGGALRAGANVRFEDRARVSFEFDRQAGDSAFVAEPTTRVGVMLGVALR